MMSHCTSLNALRRRLSAFVYAREVTYSHETAVKQLVKFIREAAFECAACGKHLSPDFRFVRTAASALALCEMLVTLGRCYLVWLVSAAQRKSHCCSLDRLAP